MHRHIESTDIFHVHTYRCGHAQNVSDRDYIEKAITLGATGIWFTDHCPFPGDPFGNRMSYDELGAYLKTLGELKKEYEGRIEVHAGLEAEYFPSYEKKGYYEKLSELPGMEMLLLGQHMAELWYGGYTFGWDIILNETAYHSEIGEALVNGINSGHFDAVAHPDRTFRYREWDSEVDALADNIVFAAQMARIPLEQNESSKKRKNQYRNEFWEIADGRVEIIRGLDAHSLKEMDIFTGKDQK